MLRSLVRKAASASWSVNSTPCLIANRIQLFQTKHFSIGLLPDGVDRSSDTFAQNSDAMERLLSELQSHINKVLAGGGETAVKRNRSRNKLLPRERIDRLLDPGSSFLELSQLAGHELYGDPLPSAGIITGIGPVHGRLCMFVANDPTVKGGTYYPITIKKHLRAQEIAAQCKLPCIYLVDSGGAFLPVATLMAALGELNIHSPSQIQTEKKVASLKEKLATVTPLLEDLRMKKEERIKQFADIKSQIEKISGEISGYSYPNDTMISCLTLEDQDMSLRKLTEFQTHLQTLQKEKSDRLHKVLEYVNEVHLLCGVLGLDFAQSVSDVHPSLQRTNQEQSTNISNGTFEGLEQTINKLKTERRIRIQKLRDIVAALFELWNLMDSPQTEKNVFSRATSVLRLSEAEVAEPGVLSTEMIEQAAAEVERLTKLKASRMKELVMKRRSELEDICRMTHIEPDASTAVDKSNALIDSGLVDPSELLANIEAQISKAKDEALSRKEIMDRIDRWLSACEEENWLEDYNQDENRYNAGRGAHINLKRAEKARVTVTKIPAIVDNLINRTLAWEEEKKMLFLYDRVRLVSILEDYKVTRKQREEEKKRCRDQKKIQDLLLTEREAIYGSKPSPRKSNSFRKPNGYRANGNGSMTPTPRRNSVGGGTPELLTPRSYSGRQNGYFKEMRRLSTAPLNFVAISKEDTISTYTSICGSELGSPPHG